MPRRPSMRGFDLLLGLGLGLELGLGLGLGLGFGLGLGLDVDRRISEDFEMTSLPLELQVLGLMIMTVLAALCQGSELVLG